MSDAPNELSVTTFIAASPQRVWRAMDEEMEKWWCPVPWRTEIVEQDKRAGGRSYVILRGPDGEEEKLEGIYLAYEPGRRFVCTDAVDHHFNPQGPFMVGIWEIEPEGEGTRYTARARHWTAEAMKTHDEMGFTDGWAACAQQLKDLCEGG